MHDSDPAEAAAVRDVDCVPVREPRNEERREIRERRFVVEAPGELLTCLGEHAQALTCCHGRGSRPLALCHVADHDAHADHLVGGISDRVVADEPVACLAGRRPRAALDGEIEDRLAGFEHVPVMRLDRAGELLPEDLAQRPAEMLLGGEPVGSGQSLVHAHVPVVGVHEGQSDGRGREDRVHDRERVERLPASRLRLAEEQRVVDSGRRAPRKVLRRREVALVVATARLCCDEGDRSEDAVASDERHAHGRAQPKLTQQLE